MEYCFSDKIASLKPSAIREVLKATSVPGMIPFAAGNPAPDAFPVAEVQEIAADILKNRPIDALQYGVTEGYPELISLIKTRMKSKYGIGRDFDSIIITSGAQQVMDLSTKVLCNEGDVVICESPSFIGSLNCFRSYNAKLVGVPVDADGMNIEALEKALDENPNAKMIYTIPNFQNPAGVTMSLEKRHKLYELAKAHNVMILEDNPYGELRFEGEYMPALKSLDTKGLVIYLGTFSKILAPGYRLGWVCADDEILAKYNFMEQAASLQASTIGQMETSKWIDMFDLDAHVNTIRECYKKRRAVMLETLAKELPEPCTFTRPEGGLFAWVVLPEYMDAKDLQMKCLEKKVAFVPGGSFFPNGGHDNTLRLNYSCMPEEKIVQGITALCQTIRENLR